MATDNTAKSDAAVDAYPDLYMLLHDERVSLGTESRNLETTAATAFRYIGVPLVLLAGLRALAGNRQGRTYETTARAI